MTATNPRRPQTMTMIAATITATNHDDQRHNLVKFIQRCHEFGCLKSTPLVFLRFHCSGRHGIRCGGHGLWRSRYRPKVVYALCVCVVSLVVSAVDGGPAPVNSDLCEVFVSVVDVNEFTPTFPTRFFFTETVSENRPVGTFVFTAKASDKDAGPFGVVRYQMVPTSAADVGAFHIDEVTGDVTTGMVFNATAKYLSFQYRITATDAGRLNSTVGAIIRVCNHSGLSLLSK